MITCMTILSKRGPCITSPLGLIPPSPSASPDPSLRPRPREPGGVDARRGSCSQPGSDMYRVLVGGNFAIRRKVVTGQCQCARSCANTPRVEGRTSHAADIYIQRPPTSPLDPRCLPPLSREALSPPLPPYNYCQTAECDHAHPISPPAAPPPPSPPVRSGPPPWCRGASFS